MANFYDINSLPIEGDEVEKIVIHSYYYNIYFKSGKKIDVLFYDEKSPNNTSDDFDILGKYSLEEYNKFKE